MRPYMGRLVYLLLYLYNPSSTSSEVIFGDELEVLFGDETEVIFG